MKLPKINSFKLNKGLVIKIINILSLVFAVGAIFLSYLLYTKRAELYNTNNEMAAAINKASVILDKNSGTKTSGKISIDAVKNSYETPIVLQTFKKQANDVVSQRDAMGTAMGKISKDTPGAEGLSKDSFNSITSYNKSIETLLKSSDDLGKLRSKLANYLITLAKTLNIQLANEDKLTKEPSSKEYEDALKLLNEDAALLVEKAQTNKNEVATVLDNLDNLDKLKIELNKYIDLDSDYKILLEEKDAQNTNLSKETDSLNSQISAFKQKFEELNKAKEKPNSENPALSQAEINSNDLLNKLHGEVKKYDKKWGNVIINLGKSNKVQVKTNNKTKSVNVPLTIGNELIVARNDKFVARIKVEQVFDDYSLATILFPLNKEIKPGDIVFHPSN